MTMHISNLFPQVLYCVSNLSRRQLLHRRIVHVSRTQTALLQHIVKYRSWQVQYLQRQTVQNLLVLR